MFHIGTVVRSVGNAFACSPDEFWQEDYKYSASGLTVTNYTSFYPFLINREGKNISRGRRETDWEKLAVGENQRVISGGN